MFVVRVCINVHLEKKERISLTHDIKFTVNHDVPSVRAFALLRVVG